MKRLKSYKKGVTLPEVLTVIVIVVMVTLVSMPAVDSFFDSMASQGSAEAMINAALSSARAMATSEHKYVGIRFQKIYDERGPLFADQYLIFIVYDYDRTELANGFRAIEGLKPMKLPENIGVMDLYYGSDNDQGIDDDLSDSLNPVFFNDATTFSIVFSPSSKLVIHQVRIDNINNDIFNDVEIITDPVNPIGMFVQETADEPSRRAFVIYNRKEFRRAYDNLQPVTGYLGGLTPVYINSYTGTIISQGR